MPFFHKHNVSYALRASLHCISRVIKCTEISFHNSSYELCYEPSRNVPLYYKLLWWRTWKKHLFDIFKSWTHEIKVEVSWCLTAWNFWITQNGKKKKMSASNCTFLTRFSMWREELLKTKKSLIYALSLSVLHVQTSDGKRLTTRNIKSNHCKCKQLMGPTCTNNLIKRLWCQNLFLPHCLRSQVEELWCHRQNRMQWLHIHKTLEDRAAWFIDPFIKHRGSWNMPPSSPQIKAKRTRNRPLSSQTVLLLRREKGCSGVHPADITEGKQDTAGQRRSSTPKYLRSPKPWILYGTTWRATRSWPTC